MAEYDPAVHGPLAGERARYDPQYEAIQRARREDTRDAIKERVMGFGAGLQGRTPQTEGMTDLQRAEMRRSLIELLNAKDRVKAELKQQKMRYAYQARTADATILTALSNIIREGLSYQKDLTTQRMMQQIQQHVADWERANIAASEKGFDRNKFRTTREFTNASNNLNRFTQQVMDQNTGQLKPVVTTDREEAADFLSMVQNQAQGLDGLQRAIYFDEVKRKTGVDIIGIYNTIGTGGEPESATGRFLQGVSGGQFEAVLEGVRDAQKAGEQARALEDQYQEYGAQVVEEMDRFTGAAFPGPAKFALSSFKEILERQTGDPNAPISMDPTGRIIVATGQAQPAVGVEERLPTQEPEEEVPDLARKEIEELLEELKGPNPSRQALRLKASLFRDPTWLTWANEKYGGNLEKALEFGLTDYDHRKKQAGQEANIARREEVLENPEQHSVLEQIKANLGKTFGRQRTRWQEGYERRQAEAAAAAAAAEAAPPVEGETPPAGEPVPAPPVGETTEEVDPKVQEALEEIARLREHGVSVAPKYARQLAKRAKRKRREAFERIHRGHWQARGDGKPPKKAAADAASGDTSANTPGATGEMTEDQATEEENKPKPKSKDENSDESSG